MYAVIIFVFCMRIFVVQQSALDVQLSQGRRQGEGGMPPFAAWPPFWVPRENRKYNYNSHCFQGLTQSKAAHLTVIPVDTTSAVA